MLDLQIYTLKKTAVSNDPGHWLDQTVVVVGTTEHHDHALETTNTIVVRMDNVTETLSAVVATTQGPDRSLIRPTEMSSLCGLDDENGVSSALEALVKDPITMPSFDALTVHRVLVEMVRGIVLG